MGVSKNRGTPKWMVYNGKPYQNGWFGGKTHYFRKHPNKDPQPLEIPVSEGPPSFPYNLWAQGTKQQIPQDLHQCSSQVMLLVQSCGTCWAYVTSRRLRVANETIYIYGGFLKWWYPKTIGFPTRNDHFGVFWGYHHLRKHPYEHFSNHGIPDTSLESVQTAWMSTVRIWNFSTPKKMVPWKYTKRSNDYDLSLGVENLCLNILNDFLGSHFLLYAKSIKSPQHSTNHYVTWHQDHSWIFAKVTNRLLW